ncbi:hypothetical protein [Paractinoplanes toevensis]|uniref:Uncharacterized protein n=1 Tax=Paractinoplanes toevensis TaxID=571911 RepID=A0A919W3E2_9ACTN|nr:hypothetical protein [Actinoplanes toevensis]GIM92689.1 hypothetical protein Ato02nite_044820 [Actinoplanes toevensis]
MSFRTSAKLLGVTLGVAALAGASQLGLAYGLGIVRLTRVLDLTARDQWTAQLAWVAWLAMIAAVIGGMAGRPHLPTTSGPGTRLVTAVAAGLGAAVVVPLTMQPARTAQVAGVQPSFVIGVCAALGATAGLFAAYAALSRSAARLSFLTVGIATWAIALLSVAPSLAPGKELPSIRLGVIDAAFLPDGVTQRTALFTMPLLALISGIALGWAARRRDASTLTIALAGLPGPALLTVAYLIAGPGTGDDGYQAVPYWAAMTAAGAGVLGSVLAAVLRRSPDSGDPRPTPNRPPLPKRDPEPESAIAQAGAAATPAPVNQPPTQPPATQQPPVEMPPFDGFKKQGRAQPQQISPPLPHPTPIAPPPQVKGRRQAEPDGVAEWVSGLGNG